MVIICIESLILLLDPFSLWHICISMYTLNKFFIKIDYKNYIILYFYPNNKESINIDIFYNQIRI
jgi:hypothetical protein